MPTIAKLHAREILDSRDTPTVEVECTLNDGTVSVSSVPSGASTGKYEAVELRDNDPKEYSGKGVLKAVEHVNTMLNDALVGKDSTTQQDIDSLMVNLDGTPNDANLGANAILGVSLAVARASAQSQKLPLYEYIRKVYELSDSEYILPTPMLNVLNGGKHVHGSTDIQEFMIIPNAPTFSKALEMASDVFHALFTLLNNSNRPTTVGDEGGFAPQLVSNTEPFTLLTQAVHDAGYTPGTDIAFAIDAAASELYSNGTYHLTKENKTFSSDEFISFFETLLNTYPLVSLEDILDQEDWQGWAVATQRLGARTQLVGDDLFVTNTKRLQQGIDQRVANSILIKLNQIGTLTQTVLAVELAKKSGYTAIISHRSGETEDTTIADLAVALNVGQIKTGSLSRTERIAKYNQLLRIEEQLGDKAQFKGLNIYTRKAS